MIKINNGFVTNSSSTSYIISSKSNKIFSKDEFLKLIGINDGSLLKETFANLYNVILEDVRPVEMCLNGNTLQDFLKHKGFSDKEIDEILKRHSQGEYVFYGKLSDSGIPEETYFSMQSFIVINDDFYFNAEVDAY